MFAACLSDECAALEHLLFKLEEEHLVLASGRHRWLDQASAEVSAAVETLDLTERRRLGLADAIIGALGLPVAATLGDIADAIDIEQAEVLRDYRRRMRDLLEKIHDLVQRNRDLLARGLAATADALALLGAGPTAAYDATGAPPPDHAGFARIFDARA
ncbi:MAG TPA: flagellar protein FlgN [Acidimicrobiales bacterium]|nr:flagellar protein FlgN [Acidimicrobiales bacterium]